MIEFFLPLVIAFALGISPGDDGNGTAAAPDAAREALPETPAAASGFTPEPQVPTGQFTTALEVRPILDATRNNWVAIRDWEGQDWVYFTHLLSWRCGLFEISFTINGAGTPEVLEMEECHLDTAAPSALISDLPIYRTFPAGSVETVEIFLVYDDGTTDSHAVERRQVLMP